MPDEQKFYGLADQEKLDDELRKMISQQINS